MNSTKTRNRFGGALGIIVGIIAIIAIAAGISLYYIYSKGEKKQQTQTKLWSEAFTLFSQKQPEAAYLKLVEARFTFGDDLDLYRAMAEGDYLSKEEINEAIVLICQSEAYDSLFNLEPATDWITKAKLEVINIADNDSRNELSKFIDRAEAANNYCLKYKECLEDKNLKDEKYQAIVKESLKTASQALDSSDYDYTTFEIRFLIACGKSFNEPILVSEARKQLFDLTHIFGEDEKTKLLWSLLRK